MISLQEEGSSPAGMETDSGSQKIPKKKRREEE
jgi:hypothetical protein